MGSVLELFAGCGGAALGLKQAGWDHVALVERDPSAAATLRAAGLPVIEQDVRHVDFEAMGDIDLLWASPPCQAGSVAGRRRGAEDDRNGWPWLFDAIDRVQPRWMLCENVRGWTYHRRGCSLAGQLECIGCYWEQVVLPEARRRFPFTGTWVLDAADFGTPQHRRRVILWGGPLPLSPTGPAPSHRDPTETNEDTSDRTPWVSLQDAIGDTLLTPQTCATRRCYPCDGSHGQACTQPWRMHLPAPTVTTTEVKGTRAHSPDWAIRRGPDRASDTAFLIAGVRRIEVHEGLTLQGFPTDWPLQGTRLERYRQVGNAVPPSLARALGEAIAHADRVGRAVGNLVELGQALAEAGEVVALPSQRSS